MTVMAATKIKAACPVCGPIELRHPDVMLRVCSNVASLSEYVFTCPNVKCRREVRKEADDFIIRLLVQGGVRPTTWRVPDEALEPHNGPPISHDDLLDFHLALSRV